MLLRLEFLFVHRMRGQERKGGALQELRGRTAAIVDGGSPPPAREEVAVLVEAVFAEVAERYA